MLDTTYLDNFREVWKPDDVDVLSAPICTQTMWAGTTRLDGGKWVPTFPNAAYHFVQTEYDLEVGSGMARNRWPCC